MSISKTLDQADEDLVRAVRDLHIGAQLARFLRLTVFAFVAQLATVIPADGSRLLPWTAVAAVAVGALETSFRQMFPAFQLSKTANVVTSAVKSQATQVATTAVNTLIASAQERQKQAETLLGALAGKAKAEAAKLGVDISPSSESSKSVPADQASRVTVNVSGTVADPADLTAAVAKAFTPPATPSAP